MYQEYPKWVSVGKLDPVLVQSAEEEADLTDKSLSVVTKAAEKHEKEGEAAQAETDELELQKIEDKGTAVSEADMVKLTDPERRKPGRPAKA